MNLQWGRLGADVVRMNLIKEVTGSDQDKHGPLARQGVEDRDVFGSSAEDEHWSGSRTEKEPTDKFGMMLVYVMSSRSKQTRFQKTCSKP